MYYIRFAVLIQYYFKNFEISWIKLFLWYQRPKFLVKRWILIRENHIQLPNCKYSLWMLVVRADFCIKKLIFKCKWEDWFSFFTKYNKSYKYTFISRKILAWLLIYWLFLSCFQPKAYKFSNKLKSNIIRKWLLKWVEQF